MNTIALFLATSLTTVVHCGTHGFHFNRFSGPVSGPISRIELPHSKHGGLTYDYVAKPDYNFAFGVEDPESGNYQNQKEERDGDVVRGEYSLVGADGITRRVTYTADDKHGFQATVHTSPVNEGHARQQAKFAAQLQSGLSNHLHHPHQEEYSEEHEEDY